MPTQKTVTYSDLVDAFITNKKLILFIIIICLVFAIALYFHETNRKEVIYAEYQEAIKASSLTNSNALSLSISTQKKHIKLIGDLPGIQEFTHYPPTYINGNQLDTDSVDIRRKISLSFKALLKQETEIRQARLLLNNGSEYIRVERNGSELLITPPNLLQSKENRDYFKMGMILPDNELYISPISPNYEHGKLEFPIWPTYRIIKNLRDKNKVVIGLLVLNIDVSNALLQLNANKQANLQGFENYLVDTNGYYIAAPSSTLLFGEDLAHKDMNWFIQTDHSIPLISTDQILTNFRGEPYLFASQELMLTNTSPESRYYLITGIATKKIDDKIQAHRKELFITLLGFIFLIVIIVYFFSKHIIHLEKLYFDQSRFRAIIENSSDAILSINKSGEILSWNHAATILFGLNNTEAIGQYFFNLVNASTDQDFSPPFLQDIIDKDSNLRIEVSPSIKHKLQRFLLLTLCPIDKKDGDDDAIALIIRDITHEKVNQKKLEALNSDLDNKVKKRTKELEAEKQKALKANQIKSMFVANISHELRTPLNGVSGLLTLARDKNNHEKRDDYLNMAQESAQTLNVLINDLLDFSKIESGKLELNPKLFNIIGLLEHVLTSTSFLVKDKNIELILDTSRIEVTWILLDENRIKQILINLLSNAIKFTNEGEVVLTASTHFAEDNDQVVICEFQVSDTGVGIAKDQQSKLFKPFIQASAGIANKFGGTGLGLSISKQLCEMMKGSLTLESQCGEGSTFKATIHCSMVNTKLSKSSDNNVYLDNHIIALYITNDQTRRVLRNQFHTWKASVVLIQDNDDLYTQAKNTDLYLALLDYELFNQDMDDHLHKHKVKVVYITNIITALDTNKALDFITKPVTPSQLLSIFPKNKEETNTSESSENDTKQTTQALNISEANLTQEDTIKDNQTQTVFVVDDNEINRIVGQGILSILPLKIETAVNGEDLLDKLQKLEPSHYLPIILMDCQMPTLDGYAATHLIREGKAGNWLKNTPIIAMTADAMIENRAECEAAGMDDFIGKPFDPDQLKKLISQWSNKKP